jgi:2-dehydro-3-deoxy-D-pentonate aldolase
MKPIYKPHGIIVPMIRLNDDHSRWFMTNYLCENGVHGIFLLGTTGEFEKIGYKERYSTLKNVIDSAEGRCKILVGCTDDSYGQTTINVNIARDLGADCAVVIPNYHDPNGDYVEYVNGILRSVPEFPLMIYINPRFSHGRTMPLDQLEKIMINDCVIGIKDSTGDFEHYKNLVQEFPDKAIVIGDETRMLDAFLIGGAGAVPSIGNVIPNLCVRLFENGDPRRFKLSESIPYFQQQIYGNGVKGNDFTVEEVIFGLKTEFEKMYSGHRNLL